MEKKRRNCAAMQSFYGQIDNYPQHRENLFEIENFINSYTPNKNARASIFKIPVVVHIVIKNSSLVTDAQVREQINTLNEDFRSKNRDRENIPSAFKGLVADAGIEFYLVNKDPQGRATDGIIRHSTNIDEFSMERESVKYDSKGGADAWDTEKYLNIWVCNITSTDTVLLGYAQFPGGRPETDGVVVHYNSFGSSGSAEYPFNLGRTLTHEIGHYLNLSHIWGESRIANCSDDDYVVDTPRQRGSNSNKPTYPSISCSNGPHGDLFMNYMDYVDDDSMYMFTHGQVNRMRAVLAGSRRKLVN